MNEIELLVKQAVAYHDAGTPFVLVSVLNLEGSTPRHEGTKMLVGGDGKTFGTIGGSLIEASAIVEAKKLLLTRQARLMSFDLTGTNTTLPDMICGGKAEILLDVIEPTADNGIFLRQWQDAFSRGQEFYLLTHLNGTADTARVLGHGILLSDNETFFSTSLTKHDIGDLKPELHNVSTTLLLPLGDARVMIDRIRKVKTLYCFGAGHVAVPTAHLAALVGFRVIVLDDRPEFANAERFPDAINTIVVDDFDRALEGLEIDKDSFIVIVTRGHQYDRTVLDQSLKTNAGYIGMISSKRKRQTLYEALMASGVKKEQLDGVYSPIGIDIGGETPEEIAVSIVAELIKVRSEQAK